MPPSTEETKRHRLRWNIITLIALIILFPIIIREYIDWSGRQDFADTLATFQREGETLDLRKAGPPAIPDDQNFCAIPTLDGLFYTAKYNATIPAAVLAKQQALMQLSLDPPSLRYANHIVAASMPDPMLQEFVEKWSKTHGANKYYNRPSLTGGLFFGEQADIADVDTWTRLANAQPPLDGKWAEDLIASFAPKERKFAEFTNALDRPGSQWTPAWSSRTFSEPLANNNFTASDMAVRIFTGTLSVRCIAAARIGDASKAQQSAQIVVRIAQADAKEPQLIGIILAGQTIQQSAADVWELCNAHCGSADNFHALQQALSQINISDAMAGGLRGYAALTADTASYFGRSQGFTNSTGGPFGSLDGDADTLSLLTLLISRGGLDANIATLVRWQYDYGLQPLRAGGLMQLLAKQDELGRLMLAHEDHPVRYWNELIPTMTMRGQINIVRVAIYNQALLNQAIAACALERYRIAHGNYPDTLAEANQPGEPPIPNDVLTGKPMSYRKTPDGKFTLWCVPFSGTDHGGVRGTSGNPADRYNTHPRDPTYNGDWVWSYQPN